MVIEDFIFEWLSEELGTEILTAEKGGYVSLHNADYSQINKWMSESVFVISALFSTKRESYQITRDVITASRKLPLKNGINAVGVETVKAERINNPPSWRYTIILRVRHRNFADWG